MQNLNLLLEVFLFVSFIWSLLCNENKKRIERRQLSWLIWISRLELQFERRPARNAPIKRLEITLSWVASAWRWPAYRRKNWSQLISFNERRLPKKKKLSKCAKLSFGNGGFLFWEIAKQLLDFFLHRFRRFFLPLLPKTKYHAVNGVWINFSSAQFCFLSSRAVIENVVLCIKAGAAVLLDRLRRQEMFRRNRLTLNQKDFAR